jgi:hypothetical protein
VTLATDQGSPNAIAVDASGVYWPGPHGIMTAHFDSDPKLVVSASASSSVAVDDTRVYWIDNTTISAVAKTGGTPIALVSGLTGGSALAVDATSAYWTSQGEVAKVALAGGTPTQLAPLGTPYPFDLAIDASAVYWMDPGNSMVNQAGLDGSSPMSLAKLTGSGGIAVDAHAIYWAVCTGLSDSGVVALTRGTTALTTLATGARCPLGVALDDTFVYWTDYAVGTVNKTPIAGGTTEIVASNQPGAAAIAVDATALYWTNVDGGTVMMRTRK